MRKTLKAKIWSGMHYATLPIAVIFFLIILCDIISISILIATIVKYEAPLFEGLAWLSSLGWTFTLVFAYMTVTMTEAEFLQARSAARRLRKWEHKLNSHECI